MRKLVGWILLTSLMTTNAHGQGLATWVGDRIGLGNVGRAMDKAHKDVKQAVPLYGRAEETVTGEVRKITQEAAVQSTAPILKNYILASRNNALSGSSSLPPEVIWEFSGFYPPNVLSARWNVGSGNDLSLQSNSFRFGDRAGIALDTVVVFRSWSDAYSPRLWAHELAHIEQYRAWGIDDFTKRYIRSSDEIEAAANRRADEFMQYRASRLSAPLTSPPLGPSHQSNGNMCVTPQNYCPWTGPVGWNCVCASPYGLQNGTIQ